MFAFSFMLIPFYNLICKTFGITGKTNSTATTESKKIDVSRSITIQFLANVNTTLPWQLYPQQKQINIHPGENQTIFYIAKNNSNETITAQAVPSVTPGIAGNYFKKIECFCFRKQTLQPHQEIKMPVIFYIDPQLPKNIHEITLLYTMYTDNN